MFWYSLKIISLMKDSPYTIRSLVMYTQTHMHHLSIAQLLEKKPTNSFHYMLILCTLIYFENKSPLFVTCTFMNNALKFMHVTDKINSSSFSIFGVEKFVTSFYVYCYRNKT